MRASGLLLLLGMGCTPSGAELAVQLREAQLFVGHRESPPAADAKGWEPVTLPDRWSRERRLRATEGWYRFEVDLAREPNELEGVFLRRASMNAQIYANGALVGQGGRFEAPIARNVFHPTYAPVPRQLLHAGRNVLHVRLALTHGTLGLLEPIWFGPDRVLRPAYERTRFLSRNVTQLAHFIAVLVALVAAYRVLRSHSELPGMGWLSAGVLAFSTGSMSTLFSELPVPSRVMEWIVWSFLGLAVALAGAGLRRAAERQSRLHDGLSLGFAVGFPVALALTPYPSFLPAVALGLALMAGLALDGCVSASRALRQGRLSPRAPILILLAFILAYPVFELWVGPPDHLGFHPTLLNTPVAVACLAWFLLARIMKAVQEAQRLDAELVAQEARAALERDRAIASERDRIVQDMHDGTAGHLASALSMVRAGSVDDQQLSAVLQDALDDLRATIEALDPAERSLAGVIGVLRDPLERRLHSQGMSLDWRIGDIDHVQDLEPTDAGNLLRLIQEAVANAIRHADAQRVVLSAARAEDSDGVLLSVADDGRGGAAARAGGRGLANMQRRARELGGRLEIESHPKGTRISLWLPGSRAARRDATSSPSLPGQDPTPRA